MSRKDDVCSSICVFLCGGRALDLELVDNTAAGELSSNKWNQQNWFPTTIGMPQQSTSELKDMSL
jgi:hypothetical protein